MKAEVKTYLNSIAVVLLSNNILMNEFESCESVDEVKAALSAKGINPDGTNQQALFGQQSAEGNAGDLPFNADEEPEPETPKSDLYLNIDLMHDGRPRRVGAVSLDFALFSSKENKEAGKENGLVRAIMNHAEKHGVDMCNEKLEFVVTMTKTGESSIKPDTQLF